VKKNFSSVLTFLLFVK